MKDLINGQPEQDIEHCATCIHDADSEDICILRKCKYAIAELKDCYEPERRWIPCSERLPEENGDYYVTTHTGQIARYVFIKGASEEYWMRCAIAWMPLPEPYKEDDHETD